MLLEDLKLRFQYNNWADSKMLEALIVNEIRDEKILIWMAHIINAKWIWMNRIQSLPHSVSPWQERSLSECQQLQKEFSLSISAFLHKRSELDLSQIIHYQNSKGIAFSGCVKDILTHIVNHSTHHRAQIAAKLRELDFVPPSTDFIFFVR